MVWVLCAADNRASLRCILLITHYAVTVFMFSKTYTKNKHQSYFEKVHMRVIFYYNFCFMNGLHEMDTRLLLWCTHLVDDFEVECVGGVGVEATHLPLTRASQAQLRVRHTGPPQVVGHTRPNAPLNLQLSRCLQTQQTHDPIHP